MLELINPTILAEYMLNWFDNVLGIINDKTWKKWRFILNQLFSKNHVKPHDIEIVHMTFERRVWLLLHV